MSIVLAGAAAYADGLRGPFIFDDVVGIVYNPAIRHLAALGKVLSPAAETATLQGRPFLGLSFAANYALGGLNPLGYHVFNVAVHLLAGLALYAILRSARQSPLLAWAAALLWTVHPLQTEAVTYTVQRAESLMGLLYLATFLCYIRYAETARRAWAAGAVACCLAGMGTKEVMVSAPLLAWMYDRAFLAGSFGAAWRARRGLLLGLAATWIPLVWFVASGGGNRGGSVGFGLGVRPLDWWLTQGEAVLHYLRLVFWPAGLAIDYGRFLPAHAALAAIRVALVAFLLASTIRAWRRAPRVGFLGLFFFAILAPTSLLPGTTQMIAEHRMYLASIPVLVLALAGFERWPGLRGLPIGVAAVALAALTWCRNADYRTAESIWTDTVAKRPDSGIAHYNLGYALGPSARGIAELREAIRLMPDFAKAYDVLGYDLSLEPAHRAEAMEVYRRALAIDPHDALAAHNLAKAHEDLGWLLSREPGRDAEAVAQFRAAVRLDPDFVLARFNLAVMLANDPAERTAAIAELRELLRRRPDFAPAQNLLRQLGP